MQILEAGTVLHSRYRVRRQIGSGGMGAVYEATDNRLHNTVALKHLTAVGQHAAFEQEAQFLASLRHAGLPVVIDYFTEGHNAFMAMQFIEGEDLAHTLKRRGLPCDPADVVAWGIAILDVLIYLHAHTPPIVHRDIKPANIKVTPRGDVVLLDFGLAKGWVDDQTHLADAPSVYGFTPDYAAIEQVEWRGTDPRSDLYALGATMLHLATGVRPMPAQSRAAAIATGHLDPLLRADQLNTQIGKALSDVLSRALALDPSNRFASAREMRAALAGHHVADRVTRATEQTKGARRVDAAMPSQAQFGAQIDLIVQVRFASSPLLGLEDWPTARKPEKIEQGSELLDLEYPRDPRTGGAMPARVLIRVVAPDFTVEGPREHLIEVRPDEYSKRLAFLLTARRVGYCRVNVEVYSVDDLYLGTIAIEAEAVSGRVANQVMRVAHLVLGLFSQDRSVLGLDEGAAFRDVRHGERALRSDSTPVGMQALPGRTLNRWVRVGGSLAVLVTAVALWQTEYVSRDLRDRQSPAQQPGPGPATAPPRGAATLPLPPSTSGGRAQAADPPPIASVPQPQPRLNPPVTLRSPPVTDRPAVAPERGLPPSVSATTVPPARVFSSNRDVELIVARVERTRTGVVSIELQFINNEASAIPLTIDYTRTRLSASTAADAVAIAPVAGTFPQVLDANSGTPYSIAFPLADSARGLMTLHLATETGSDAPRFPALEFRVPGK